ncbi:MAG: CcdB family protein [Psychrosphaera sp.]|nr:CcdB family protein [Psychrosphaera sp.]
MAQFDVYTNPNKKSRATFPLIVDVQNPLLCDMATRIVIPMGKLEHFKNEAMVRLTPQIDYEGQRYLLLTPQMASISANMLKNPIGSASHLRDEIIGAIDFAITGV